MKLSYAKRYFTCKTCNKLHCVWCGRNLTYTNPNHPTYATREHMKARVLGGSNKLENLEVACRLCNNIRGHRTWRKFHNHEGDPDKMYPHQRLHHFPSKTVSRRRANELMSLDLSGDPRLETQASYGLVTCSGCGLGYDSLHEGTDLCKYCHADEHGSEVPKNTSIYGMAPAVMTAPEKCPRCKSLVQDLRKASGMCGACSDKEFDMFRQAYREKCLSCGAKRETTLSGTCKKCYKYLDASLPWEAVEELSDRLDRNFKRALESTGGHYLKTGLRVLVSSFLAYQTLIGTDEAIVRSASIVRSGVAQEELHQNLRDIVKSIRRGELPAGVSPEDFYVTEEYFPFLKSLEQTQPSQA